MPARARDQAEAIARRRRGTDAPARRRRARFQDLRRPQQEERQARIDSGQLQPLARFQIEPVDHAGNGGRRARMQRLLHGPQAFSAMRRLDQNEAARIEAQRADAVAMQTAVIAQPVGREDEDDLFRPPL